MQREERVNDMRARNIKPGFYKNEELAGCSLQARLLFPGLWMMADREGRLEDRPKRIKVEIFPYDDFDVDALLCELAEAGMIVRYQVDTGKYIWIPNFLKHQNPHKKEKDSDIPAFEASPEKAQPSPEISGPAQYKHQTGTVQAPDKHHTSPADSLNPDSLNPENGILKQEQKAYPPIPPEGGCEEMPDIASPSEEVAMAMGSPETIPPDEPPESPHDPRPDSDHVPKRPKSRSPLEGVPYDGRTLSAICEMYELVPNYLPDAPSEIRLIQELGQEYPKIDLLREFRRARDWLLKAHPKKRPKGEHGLRAFLRNWVAKGVNKYGLGQPRIIGFETVTEFVPVLDEGGIANAGGP